MKICQVTPRYPPNTGGVETHVRQISERLVERGHDVMVLTADAGRAVDTAEERDGVSIRRHRSLSPGSTFHLAPGIVRSVRGVGADVVHAHNYHSLPLLCTAAGVRAPRFVVTPHYHGESASPFRNRLLSLYHPVGSWALDRADCVVAVSQWEGERLRADFDLDVTTIPNGIDRDRFDGIEPTVRDRPFLLHVGRLEEYKGVQYAIRALCELSEWDLLVAGSGPYRPELERLAVDAGVDDRVVFLGHVDEERLTGLLVGADVLLALSDFEAFGMTVAEALAAGTPCVVHERGALAEWTENPGVAGVTDRSASTVARATVSVRDNVPDGRRLVSWDTVTERLLDCYRGR